ncbi:odorant receptor Or2-like [Diabrotica virgifera virgifera]|nr:odorant receptor Or2-like [Diabrotica virgifera virgifera]
MNIESLFHFSKVFVIIVENWYINYHANELIVTSKKLSSSIFSNGWYDLDESTKKSLMLMMIRSQRPLKIDIGTIYFLGTKLFIKILKGGYTFIVFYNV